MRNSCSDYLSIFALESSCDETSWCLAEFDNLELKNNYLVSHTQKIHEEYGGVVPELSSRAHLEALQKNREEILSLINDADVLSVTEGPGLKGSLIIGSTFVSAVGIMKRKPVVPINHIEAHLFSPMINSSLRPPFISTVLSGGHTLVSLIDENYDLKILARTKDDAIGEAFDKLGCLLGMPYPFGPNLSKFAQDYSGTIIPLPIGLKDSIDFSYSGFKTAVRNYIKENDIRSLEEKKKLAASIQYSLVESVILKIKMIREKFGQYPLGFSGGVSSNYLLRQRLQEEFGNDVFIPAEHLCVDNALIIAFLCNLKMLLGKVRIELPKIFSRWIYL